MPEQPEMKREEPAPPPPSPGLKMSYTSRRPLGTSPAMTALLGALFPVVGLAMALIRAFDRDPKYRREAPYYFAGAVVGILVGLILIALILPMYL